MALNVKTASDWMSLFNYGGGRSGYSASVADRYGDGSASRDYSSGKVI